jgi:hypothetical protein
MPVTWRCDETSPPVYTLAGILDETANLQELAAHLVGPAVLDLRDVRRISSAGTRNWLTLMRRIPSQKLVLRACSRAVVEQMNMLLDFTGAAKVESVVVPFECPNCQHNENVLAPVAELRRQLVQGPPQGPACSECRTQMTLTEDPDGYFMFLRYVDTTR